MVNGFRHMQSYNEMSSEHANCNFASKPGVSDIARVVQTSVPGVLLIWIIVGQEFIALAIGTGVGWFDVFLPSIFSVFFLPLWEPARYRLKHCLKGPFNQKPT